MQHKTLRLSGLEITRGEGWGSIPEKGASSGDIKGVK